MTNADLVKEWLSLAKDDLLSAEHLFNTMRPVPLEVVAFHCQQAAEKHLKALLQFCETDIPRTHDVLEILVHLENKYPDLSSLKDPCSELNAYSVAVRYPGGLDISMEDVRSALAQARRIRAAVEKKLQQQNFMV